MSKFQENTGVQPVKTGTKVDVIFRNGLTANNVPAGQETSPLVSMNFAEDWTITGDQFDIVKWRLAEVN